MGNPKQNLARAIIFSIPFIIVFLLVFLSGEVKSVDSVIKFQKNHQALYGPTATESQYKYYKAEMSRVKMRDPSSDPSVLVLGDSRVLQVRGAFFKESISFYNAGYVVSGLKDMRFFLESQEIENIDFLIIDLHQPYFNILPKFVENDRFYTPPRRVSFVTTLKSVLKRPTISFLDYFGVLWDTSLIGMAAKLNLSGMMSDGSYYYGAIYRNAENDPNPESRVQNAIKLINKNSSHFIRGDHVNKEALENLKELLQYCYDNNIYLIAFAPPFPSSVNDAMKLDGGYGYQVEFLDIAPGMFEKYGFEFYDYTDISALGCTDEYFVDGYHCGDVAILRMFLDMMQKGSRISELCDRETLESLDDNRVSNLHMFGSVKEY